MVSTGDTEISLHIRSPTFWAYRGLLWSRTENTQSAKICLNFNLGWRGGYSGVKYSKCQDLPKFQFGRGGHGGVSGLKFQRGSLENLDTNFTV